MADFDPNTLLQNPLLLSGLGILGNKGNNVAGNIAQGIQSAQQAQLGPVAIALKKLELQRQQNAMNFNPADYMQTDQSDQNGLLSGASSAAQQQAIQPGAIPAAIGGPMGGAMPSPAPTGQVQFAPGQPVGQPNLDLPGLVTAGLKAGMTPQDIQAIGMSIDPERYARMQAQVKAMEPYTLAPGAIRGNPLMGNAPTENTNAPPTSELGQLNALTAARDKLPPGSPGWNTLDAAIKQKSGQASQNFRQQALQNMNMRLYGDPEENDKLAQGVANYTIDPKTLGSYGSLRKSTIIAKAMELNPQYNQQDFATSQQTANAFAKGAQGDKTRAMNVGINHLGTLLPLIDAIQNGNMPAINTMANAYKYQTGKEAPTNLAAVKAVVADEISNAIVGSRNALGDRDTFMKTMNENNSPEQLKGVVTQYIKLMSGQLGGLEQQYKAGTRRSDFQERFLTPEARAALSGGQMRVPVRTGTINGKKVIQYSDGSIEQAGQ